MAKAFPPEFSDCEVCHDLVPRMTRSLVINIKRTGNVQNYGAALRNKTTTSIFIRLYILREVEALPRLTYPFPFLERTRASLRVKIQYCLFMVLWASTVVPCSFEGCKFVHDCITIPGKANTIKRYRGIIEGVYINYTENKRESGWMLLFTMMHHPTVSHL